MKNKVEKSGQAWVSRQKFKSGSPTSDAIVKEELLEIRTFVTQPAQVSVELGVTLNLGNFNSARINVGISIPCYVEDQNDTYAYAREWVISRVNEEQAVFKKPIENKSKSPNLFDTKSVPSGSINTSELPDYLSSDKTTEVNF